MPGQRPIFAMSFVASLGIVIDFLACFKNKNLAIANNRLHWYTPMAVFVFYILSPVPFLICKRLANTASDLYDRKQDFRDLAVFLTMGIVVSAIALPILFAKLESPLMTPLSVFLLELGNILCLSTIVLICVYFKPSSTPGF